MTAKIRFDGVGKVFRARGNEVTALDDITFDVHSGEFVVLVGPSGCGKSTLLDLLGGLSTPTSGRILVDGAAVTGPGLDRSIVFQQYALLPWRTALGNVAFGLEAKGVRRRERAAQAHEFLDLVGLTGFHDRYPHELSGHAVPDTLWPCWRVKKLRPFPAHSTNAVTDSAGRRRRSA
jgi:NitT/TauT family transport system ATP-binding protein